MMRDGFTSYRWDELPLEKVNEMVSRKAVQGDAFELVQVYFKKGTIVPRHAHASERLVYLLQGAVRVVSDQHDVTLREGEVLVVPRGLSYQVECLDDAFVMVAGASAG